jgi:hypothetical protein
MTISYLSPPLDVASTITSYIPDEDILRIRLISKVWKNACSDLDSTYLQGSRVLDTLKNGKGDCSRIILMLNSDQLQPEKFEEITTPSLTKALFMKSLNMIDEKFPMILPSKKNIAQARQIRAILLEKFSSIINKRFIIKQLAEIYATDYIATSFFFNIIIKMYLKNERFTSDEMYYCLETFSKLETFAINDNEFVVNVLLNNILLNGECPLNLTITTPRQIFDYNLNQAKIRAEKQNNIQLLRHLKTATILHHLSGERKFLNFTKLSFSPCEKTSSPSPPTISLLSLTGKALMFVCAIFKMLIIKLLMAINAIFPNPLSRK